jgi:hypothetical protein
MATHIVWHHFLGLEVPSFGFVCDSGLTYIRGFYDFEIGLLTWDELVRLAIWT